MSEENYCIICGLPHNEAEPGELAELEDGLGFMLCLGDKDGQETF